MLGLAEARRNRASRSSRTGRGAEAPALIAEARDLLRRAGLEPNMMVGRALRTEAGAALRLGPRGGEARQLEARAAGRFAIAAPGERPEAVTLFLAGRSAVPQAGRRAEALDAFRAGAAILRARQIALPVGLVMPYLDALEPEAHGQPGPGRRAAAPRCSAPLQLAQRSSTARFVQQASARLGAAAGDQQVPERGAPAAGCRPRAARPLRRARRGGAAGHRRSTAASPRRRRARAEAESEVAAAAPGLSPAAARRGRCRQRRGRARGRTRPW